MKFHGVLANRGHGHFNSSGVPGSPSNNFGHFGLVDVFLQGPVAGAIAIGIRVDVVGLDAIALLIDPGVVVGGGILGDQAGVGIEAFLLVE